MKRRILALVAACTFPVAAQAQFSADLPGIPRAGIPTAGTRQLRFAVDLTGMKLQQQPTGELLQGRAALDLGWSYRVRSNWEFGYDLRLGEVTAHRLDSQPEGSALEDEQGTDSQGMALYALRVGIKYRPIAILSPEGHGVALALGAAYQVPLEPVIAYQRVNDTTETGGLLGKDSTLARAVGSVPQAFQLALLSGYRSNRVLVDAGLVYEHAEEPQDGVFPVYTGFSPRLGVMARVLGGLSLGAAWWGEGAPPWRARMALPDEDPAKYGLIVGLGGLDEGGSSLVITSPTGSFAKSLALYWQFRTTY